MKLDGLRKLLSCRPFKPFVIHLSGGEAIVVEQHEWLAVSPSGDAMIAFQSDGSFHIIDRDQVTDLEVKR